MLGQHLELGHYRAEFLKSHGIDVIFPENRQAALAAIRSGGFDVVLLSYSLSDDTAKELTEIIEQVRPECPIVSISNRRWEDRHVSPDATVLDTDPPQALLETLQRVQPRRKSGMRRVK